MTRAARWCGAMGVAAAALASTGCHDDVDPLDPEVLAEVARTRGDAQGVERSGIYAGEIDVLQCGCTQLVEDTGFDVSLCVALERIEALGLPPALDLEIVQADGTVRARALGLGDFFEQEGLFPVTFYGPLSADGRLSAAGVLEADALAAKGQVLGRIDGVLDGEAGAWHLVAEYQQRYALDLVTTPDVLDIGVQGDSVSVDCRERIGLDLHWIAPPFEPLPGEDDDEG